MKRRFIGSTVALVCGGLLGLAGIGQIGQPGSARSGPNTLTFGAMVFVLAWAYRSRKKRKLALVSGTIGRIAGEYLGLLFAAAAAVLQRDFLDLFFNEPIQTFLTPLWGWIAYALAGTRTTAGKPAQSSLATAGPTNTSADVGVTYVSGRPVATSRVILGLVALGFVGLVAFGGFVRLQQGGAFTTSVSANTEAAVPDHQSEPVAIRVASLALLGDAFELSYDPAKWKIDPSSRPGVTNMNHVSGGFAAVQVIAELGEVGHEHFRSIIVEQMRPRMPDLTVVSETTHEVNGLLVTRIRYAGTTDAVKLTFYNQLHSSASGTIQVSAFTRTNLFPEYERDFDDVFAGFRRRVAR